MNAAILAVAALVALALYYRSTKKPQDGASPPGDGDDVPVHADTAPLIDEAPGGIQPDVEDVRTAMKEAATDAVLQEAIDETRASPGPSIQQQPNRVTPEEEDELNRENVGDAVAAIPQPVDGELSALTVATGQFSMATNDEDGAEKAKSEAGTSFAALDLFVQGTVDEPPAGGTPGGAPEA